MKQQFVVFLSGLISFVGVFHAEAASSATEKSIYRFCSERRCADGASPQGLLTEANGTLYGTTVGGGTYGWGTVFSLSPGASEKVLHSFGNGSDGRSPTGGVINVKGVLFGTTYDGGASGAGTVFSVTPEGSYRLLHSFGSINKGWLPYAGLLSFKDKLYGTTINGAGCPGSYYGCGAVFSINRSGTEKVVYAFCQQFDCADGQLPQTPLIEIGGMLYGTTNGGRSCPFDYSPGCGTIFMVNPYTHAETVLYSFCQQKNCRDGYSPTSGLDYADGTFFGTAWTMGSGGTVFSLTSGGKFKVLHAFGDGQDGDGYLPVGVIDVNGTLYGTTTYGGAGTCIIDGSNSGCGTVFSISPEGIETVLYSFTGGRDGEWPYSGLIDVKGTLYGTARQGGRKNAGTVFSITP